jgi:putative transposase
VPRTARIVIPEVPHHVIQRGNRQQRIFLTQGDCRRYVEMLAEACQAQRVCCLAWCLMPNHVHLILTPETAAGLRAVMSSVHTRYAQRINGREQLSGHLFQDRFRSYPMNDAHLLVAARYIENNPVKAGLVGTAEEWGWSSARAHLGISNDPLTDAAALGRHVGNWGAYLRGGIEAADDDVAIEKALRSGRPIGPIGTVPPLGGTVPQATAKPPARLSDGSPAFLPAMLSSPG